MKELKLCILGHLILGPLAVWIIADDVAHPERWDVWYRNPAVSIPFCAVVDLFLIAECVRPWWRSRWDRRAVRLLKRAHRLLAEGRVEEADAAYEEGRRILDHKCKRD